MKTYYTNAANSSIFFGMFLLLCISCGTPKAVFTTDQTPTATVTRAEVILLR